MFVAAVAVVVVVVVVVVAVLLLGVGSEAVVVVTVYLPQGSFAAFSAECFGFVVLAPLS